MKLFFKIFLFCLILIGPITATTITTLGIFENKTSSDYELYVSCQPFNGFIPPYDNYWDKVLDLKSHSIGQWDIVLKGLIKGCKIWLKPKTGHYNVFIIPGHKASGVCGNPWYEGPYDMQIASMGQEQYNNALAGNLNVSSLLEPVKQLVRFCSFQKGLIRIGLYENGYQFIPELNSMVIDEEILGVENNKPTKGKEDVPNPYPLTNTLYLGSIENKTEKDYYKLVFPRFHSCLSEPNNTIDISLHENLKIHTDETIVIANLSGNKPNIYLKQEAGFASGLCGEKGVAPFYLSLWTGAPIVPDSEKTYIVYCSLAAGKLKLKIHPDGSPQILGQENITFLSKNSSKKKA